MSVKCNSICRKYSYIYVLLLLFQVNVSLAQDKWGPVTQWMKNNLQVLGGRAVLMVYKDNKVVYSHAENHLKAGQKMAVKFIAKRKGKDANEVLQDFNENSRQPIASCSKWLSAALVMSFVDEGKLSLEDSIGKFLPIMSLNGKGQIKIWQCLSHLTGIEQTGNMQGLASGQRVIGNDRIHEWKDMKTAMEIIAKQPMEGEPGKTFHYGNIGLQIAAAIIEKNGGKDFETLFAERIAKPCEMINTDFGKKALPLAAGGAWSTTTDYIHFLSMILNNGSYKGKQVLSKKSIEAMQQNRIKDADIVYSPAEAANWGYGFGEWVMNENATNLSIVSSPGLFGSFPWVDNDKKYCAFLFTFNVKTKGRNNLYTELKKLVDQAIEK